MVVQRVERSNWQSEGARSPSDRVVAGFVLTLLHCPKLSVKWAGAETLRRHEVVCKPVAFLPASGRRAGPNLWSNRGVTALLRCSAFALALLGPAVASLAQPTSDAARTVLAAVVDSQSRPLVDVSSDDFVVTEGGQPREVLDVHVADYPIAVLLDDRASVASGLPSLRAAARRFIQRVGERPIALFRMSDATAPLTSLDDERALVLERLGSFEANESAGQSPLETIAHAADMLHDSGAPFSAVVVIAAAPVDASTLVQGELLPRVIESGAAVHVVEAVPAQIPGSDASAVSDLLRVIADQTRGQFTAIYSAVSYGAALDRLADRIGIEMMIQYLVPAGSTAADVQVGIRIPGARVVGLGVR